MPLAQVHIYINVRAYIWKRGKEKELSDQRTAIKPSVKCSPWIEKATNQLLQLYSILCAALCWLSKESWLRELSPHYENYSPNLFSALRTFLAPFSISFVCCCPFDWQAQRGILSLSLSTAVGIKRENIFYSCVYNRFWQVLEPLTIFKPKSFLL